MIDLIAKAAGAPKAELHIHIEGSLEPELIFELAARNELKIPYASIEALRGAYSFTNLQSFLNIYHAGGKVLVTEEDFADVTRAYVRRAMENHVIHAEIFFDPQTHLEHGVSLETVVCGLERALLEAEELGFSSRLILCFLRHLPEEDALRTMDLALPLFERFKHRLIGVGLDSTEAGIPPSTFSRAFAMARAAGIRAVSHAGEEGPAEYIREALDILKVERVDHGVASIDDPELIERLVAEKIPLTICPLSIYRLKVTEDLSKHPLRTLLEKGVMVTVNSDDPAYFGGHVNENYAAVIEALQLNDQQVYQLLRNSFEASFITPQEREAAIAKLDKYWFSH